MNFDLSSFLMQLIDTYGAIGLSIAFCIYYIRTIHTKLEKLIRLNDRTFGILLALAKRNRLDISSKGGDLDD